MGTRLRPLTYQVPKQLIPIAGQAALTHVFDLVPPGVQEIVLACGYKAEEIARYLKAHPYPIPVRLVREETPLGTGGGMKNVADHVSDPFLLFNGDVVTGADISALVREHLRHRALGTMSLFEVEDTKPYGVAELDAEGRIVKFVEKPEPAEAPSHWINAGASIWARSLLDRIPEGRPVSFEQEIIPGVLTRSPNPPSAGTSAEGIYGFTFRNWWEDAGTLDRMLHAQRLLFDHPERRRAPWRTPAVPRVVPPVAVGEDCQIEGARVGAYVTLGDRVTLEKDSIVEDAIVMDGARIGQGAHVRHVIIGPDYRVPDGASVMEKVVANSPPG
jgi:mannose-1-phosphate guanylyltransferase